MGVEGTRVSRSVHFFVEGYLSFCRGCNFPGGGGGGGLTVTT